MDYENPILKAVRCSDVNLLKVLLAEETSSEMTKLVLAVQGHNLLSTAIRKNCIDAIILLLGRKEVSVNSKCNRGKTPLYHAVKTSNVEIVNLLIAHKANVRSNSNVLNTAVDNDCREIIEILLRNGADANFGRDRETPLFHAAKNNNLEAVKLLISNGACVLNDMIMRIAIEKADVGLVELLLQKGANANANAPYLFQAGLWPSEPYDDMPPIRLTSPFKPLPEHQEKREGRTILHIAVERGREDIVGLLAAYGSNVNRQTTDGITPLMIATKKGMREAADVLLRYGAKIDAKDDDGKTALQVACEQRRMNLIRLILSYGFSDVGINFLTQIWHLLLDPNCSYFLRPSLSNAPSSDLLNMFELLAKHFVKIAAVNSRFETACSRLKKHIFSSYAPEPEDLLEKYNSNIAEFKRSKIGDSNVTYYDFLVADVNQLVGFVRNGSIYRVLSDQLSKVEQSDFIANYKDELMAQLIKGVWRKELLEKSIDNSQLLFNVYCELPFVLLEKIFSYFSNNDLTLFICGCKIIFPHISLRYESGLNLPKIGK